MININNYKPGRFASLLEEPFAKDLWNFLASSERINLMVSAIKAGKPAIEPFLSELESAFDTYFSSTDYPDEEICVLANNMIKQILALKGYEHTACGICHNGKYFKSSGLFQKKHQ